MRRRYNPSVMPSGNYFPSVFAVTIRDEKNFEQGIDGELLLALDTSLGVTSPEGGVVEVMVHRRALQGGEVPALTVFILIIILFLGKSVQYVDLTL